jgi:hypothetical protein
VETADLRRRRLANLQLSQTQFSTPAELVAWLGAVQAQEYLHALWALGARLPGATEAAIEHALADGGVIRTWPMRGTLHFVAAADIRWILALEAPRLRQFIDNVRRYQKIDLDEASFRKSQRVLARVLRGGQQLMRGELQAALQAGGVAAATGLGLSLILQRAQADGLVCYGPRRGKQVTFTLIDDWAPDALPPMAEGVALAELARRYFTSHGPATATDFAWWAGLTLTQARAGLAAAQAGLVSEAVDGQVYWYAPGPAAPESPPPFAHFLAAYDEYVIAYKDRGALLDRPEDAKLALDSRLSAGLALDGKIVGMWNRTLGKGQVEIQLRGFRPFSAPERGAIEAAAIRYGNFLGVTPGITGI